MIKDGIYCIAGTATATRQLSSMTVWALAEIGENAEVTFTLTFDPGDGELSEDAFTPGEGDTWTAEKNASDLWTVTVKGDGSFDLPVHTRSGWDCTMTAVNGGVYSDFYYEGETDADIMEQLLICEVTDATLEANWKDEGLRIGGTTYDVNQQAAGKGWSYNGAGMLTLDGWSCDGQPDDFGIEAIMENWRL